MKLKIGICKKKKKKVEEKKRKSITSNQNMEISLINLCSTPYELDQQLEGKQLH